MSAYETIAQGIASKYYPNDGTPYTRITTTIHNPHISLDKLISFSMYKMIAALNPDTIESIDMYNVVGGSPPQTPQGEGGLGCVTNMTTVPLIGGSGGACPPPDQRVAVYRYKPLINTAGKRGTGTYTIPGTAPRYMCVLMTRTKHTTAVSKCIRFTSTDITNVSPEIIARVSVAHNGVQCTLADHIRPIAATHTRMHCNFSTLTTVMNDPHTISTIFDFNIGNEPGIEAPSHERQIVVSLMKQMFGRLRLGIEQITM